ncbi:MAG: ribonuclease J, partial [Pseudomonadota bacterium]|nr:ribonuclease J [Pseudomonadota bacterium]
FLTETDAGFLPRDKVVLIATGSQGEPRSALYRIAHDDHPEIKLDQGDTIIYSSCIIPGNEKSIGRIQSELLKQGLDIITDEDDFVHVSGHGSAPDIKSMYEALRPAISVPTHGEFIQLVAHERIAKAAGVPHTLIPERGQLIRLDTNGAEVVGDVPAGLLVFDGTRVLPFERAPIRERRRFIWHGAALATLVLDAAGDSFVDPQITLMGVLDVNGEPETEKAVINAVIDKVRSLPRSARHDDAAVIEAARIALRRKVNQLTGKKPATTIHLVRMPPVAG